MKKLPNGMYEVMIKGRRTPLIVQLQAIPVGYILYGKDEKKTKQTIPEEGSLRYYVTCDRFTIYTSMGADNVHHASNKATKLWGPHWSQLTTDAYNLRGYSFVPVKEFGELLKTL